MSNGLIQMALKQMEIESKINCYWADLICLREFIAKMDYTL